MKKVYILITLFIICINCISVNADTSGVIYNFTEDQYNWTGENETMDFLSYDTEEEALAGQLYNVGWAQRFGGVAIQGTELALQSSKGTNRFLKMMVKVDEEGALNEFDKLQVLYWYKNDATVHYSSVPLNSLSAIKGSTEYITITIDLDYKNEENKEIEKFRMDMFSSSLGKTANPTDGQLCGKIFFKYIAFFDTKEEADAYEMVMPTKEPATPTPEKSATPNVTAKADATIKPFKTDVYMSKTTKSYSFVSLILIGAVLLAAAVVIILIITIPKGRNK